MITQDAPQLRPFRRRVFYIPGYDPFHPRRYRELYRKEGSAQAELSGYSLQLSPKMEKGRYGWHVTTDIKGRRTESEVEVLVWSDIVRASMSTSIIATYLQLAKTAWVYFSSGSLWQMAKLRKGPIIAALYPAVFLLLQLVISVLFGWGGGAVIAAYSHWAVGALCGAALAYALLHWFKSKDNKVFAWYLVHDYSYGAATKGAYTPELEARIAEFTAKIGAAFSDDVDEVLVVGHSSGAHLGVSILADLIRGAAPKGELSFLTLGHAMPMVSFLPEAKRLRADLRYLSEREELFWLDISAPGDGCSFALCDPVAVTGVASGQQKHPLILSAAFRQTLSDAKQKELKRRWFRLHFQYLCAFDNLAGKPDDYDYFQITAGPETLSDRMSGRKPSASKITRPTNKHVSLS